MQFDVAFLYESKLSTIEFVQGSYWQLGNRGDFLLEVKVFLGTQTLP
jgi:hypothetical protein